MHDRPAPAVAGMQEALFWIALLFGRLFVGCEDRAPWCHVESTFPVNADGLKGPRPPWDPGLLAALLVQLTGAGVRIRQPEWVAGSLQ